jgi:hypothetical protein
MPPRSDAGTVRFASYLSGGPAMPLMQRVSMLLRSSLDVGCDDARVLFLGVDEVCAVDVDLRERSVSSCSQELAGATFDRAGPEF